MRLMPTWVIGEDEVDLLLAALESAVGELLAGGGPEESALSRPRRPVRDASGTSAPAPAGAAGRGGTMADWDELEEALADYTVSCNENERLRRMQRDWTRILHFVCSDSGTLFTMEVDRGEILATPAGHVGTPDIVVTTHSETFCDMFWATSTRCRSTCGGRSRSRGPRRT